MSSSPSPSARAATVAPSSGRPGLRRAVPGLLLSILVGALALACSRLLPFASPALMAILAGVIAVNTPLLRGAREDALRPGLATSARTVLRIGIVLLGAQLAIGEVLALGPVTLLVVVVVVGLGMGAGLLAGHLLRIPLAQTVLIACGFSICGAAAVAAANGVLSSARTSDEEESDDGKASLETQTATAIALVVVVGTLMIPAVPLLAAFLSLAPAAAGTWAGASILEVAQVVAAGGLMGETELTTAVLVKLARVLLLAPVIALLTVVLARSTRGSEAGTAASTARPPLLPGFVLGFLAAVAIRSLGVVPAPVLEVIAVVQAVLLAAAMFALGTSVRASLLRQVGGRPVVLAMILTVVVGGTGLGGALLIG